MSALAIILIAIGAPLMLICSLLLAFFDTRDALKIIASQPRIEHPSSGALKRLRRFGAELLFVGAILWAVFA